MSKQEQLERILAELQEAVPDVQGSMIASFDGLAIASTMDEGGATRVAAMTATVRALGVRVVETTGVGPFEEAVIRSEGGIFTVYEAGDLAALAVLSRVGANLGLVNLEARRTASLVADVLAPTRLATLAVTPAPAPTAMEAHDETAEGPEDRPERDPMHDWIEPAYQPATA